MRTLPLVSLALVAGCTAFQEYLLAGEATLTGALTLLSNGQGFDGASMSVGKGPDTNNRGQVVLRQSARQCFVDLQWDIDASGTADVKDGSSVTCNGQVTPLRGTLDLRDYAVDDFGESSAETGAKVTLGVDGVRDAQGNPVLSGTTTVAFGTLAGGGGTGGGGGSGGAGGGCDFTFEGTTYRSSWARCPRANFVGSSPTVLYSQAADVSWELNIADGRMNLTLATGTTVSSSSAFVTVSGETFNVTGPMKVGQTGAARGSASGTCTCNDY